jgi:hypothetical protein
MARKRGAGATKMKLKLVLPCTMILVIADYDGGSPNKTQDERKNTEKN